MIKFFNVIGIALIAWPIIILIGGTFNASMKVANTLSFGLLNPLIKFSPEVAVLLSLGVVIIGALLATLKKK